jgi:hypothetical protein
MKSERLTKQNWTIERQKDYRTANLKIIEILSNPVYEFTPTEQILILINAKDAVRFASMNISGLLCRK